MRVLSKAALKLPVFCSSATLIWRRRTTCNCPPLHYYCFYEAKLCLRKLILLLFFSQRTPLHESAFQGRLEFSCLLVESKADVAARDRCFSPLPSHHLSLTICLAAMAELHSNGPSTGIKPPSLHTCAASARRNDALPRLLRPAPRTINTYLLRVAAAVWQFSIGGERRRRRRVTLPVATTPQKIQPAENKKIMHNDCCR
jgi:hypothetical protein